MIEEISDTESEIDWDQWLMVPAPATALEDHSASLGFCETVARRFRRAFGCEVESEAVALTEAQLQIMPKGDLNAIAVESAGVNWLLVGFGAAAAAVIAAVAAASAVLGAAVAYSFFTMNVGGWDGDMKVIMGDGSKKKIKDVKIGDQIQSFNKGKLQARPVVMIEENESSTMRELLLQTSDGSQFSIKATGEHPLYTQKGWAVVAPQEGRFKTSPEKLRIGDTLFLCGEDAKLIAIGDPLPLQKTYKLSMDGQSTLFVEGILGHSGLPPTRP
ncbi:unnamed protein product [Durusdinium trenchii]|uniref:Uncharacterized protein n=2 Tax=Durusdinium trenchii TaxID=1381693 RepID=A0ABP0NGK0_9DINO